MNGNGYVGNAPYEYVIKPTKTGTLIAKRIGLIVFYVLWAVGLFLLGLMIGWIIPMLAVIAFTVWLIIFFTWRRTFLEYEFCFFDGELTVSNIYGGKSRREIVKLQLKDIASAFPYDEQHAQKAENFQPKRTYFAASSFQAENLYALLWKEEDDRCLLWIELNDTALKIIKAQNRSAF